MCEKSARQGHGSCSVSCPSQTPAYGKYPPQPIVRCDGYQPRSEAKQDDRAFTRPATLTRIAGSFHRRRYQRLQLPASMPWGLMAPGRGAHLPVRLTSCWFAITLSTGCRSTQATASYFRRYVEVSTRPRRRRKSQIRAQQFLLLLIGQRLVAQELLVVDQPRSRDICTIGRPRSPGARPA